MQNSNGKVRKSSQKTNFLEDFCEDSIFFHRELDSFLGKSQLFRQEVSFSSVTWMGLFVQVDTQTQVQTEAQRFLLVIGGDATMIVEVIGYARLSIEA